MMKQVDNMKEASQREEDPEWMKMATAQATNQMWGGKVITNQQIDNAMTRRYNELLGKSDKAMDGHELDSVVREMNQIERGLGEEKMSQIYGMPMTFNDQQQLVSCEDRYKGLMKTLWGRHNSGVAMSDTELNRIDKAIDKTEESIYKFYGAKGKAIIDRIDNEVSKELKISK